LAVYVDWPWETYNFRELQVCSANLKILNSIVIVDWFGQYTTSLNINQCIHQPTKSNKKEESKKNGLVIGQSAMDISCHVSINFQNQMPV
jgi:hypothetical protein